ncbi:MAG: 50S ribosomal protein L5 [Desulfatitalea sp. BRH_c12]|nr:MAG: 50S ribosomal protein L5 [Desulfatitalea sp. BRH_c12]
MSQLKTFYVEQVVPKLKEKFNFSNFHQIPKIDKVVLNMGLGDAIQNIKILDSAVEEMMTIAGQRPVVTRAKKSIAAFKLRAGMPIGCMVTLRRDRMFDFLEKLVNVALPRVRDFRGVSPKAFDGAGNYSLGIKEHIIFPEIDYDKIDQIKGMNISIVTTAKNDVEGRELLALMGMPFRK